MKTVEEIFCKHLGEYVPCEQKNVVLTYVETNVILKAMEEYAQQRVEEYRRKTADIMEEKLHIDRDKMFGRSRDMAMGYNDAIKFVVKSLRELPEPLPKAPTV